MWQKGGNVKDPAPGLSSVLVFILLVQRFLSRGVGILSFLLGVLPQSVHEPGSFKKMLNVVFVCVVCMCVVCMCVWQKPEFDVGHFLLLLSPLSLRQSFLLHPAAVILARMANMQAPGFLLFLSSQRWGDKNICYLAFPWIQVSKLVWQALHSLSPSPQGHTSLLIAYSPQCFGGSSRFRAKFPKLHFLGTLMEDIWSFLEKGRPQVLHMQKFSNRVSMHIQGCLHGPVNCEALGPRVQKAHIWLGTMPVLLAQLYNVEQVWHFYLILTFPILWVCPVGFLFVNVFGYIQTRVRVVP